MKIRFYLAFCFIFSVHFVLAQSESNELKDADTEQKSDVSPKTDQEKQETVEKPAAKSGEANSGQKVKAVPATKERKAKPARVSKTRPSGNRPARNVKPSVRPVRPGNGRK